MSPATDIQWVCVAYLPSVPIHIHFVASTVWHVPDEHSPALGSPDCKNNRPQNLICSSGPMTCTPYVCLRSHLV